MKILWIVNKPFPEASALLNGANELKSTGGWMLGAASSLLKTDGVELFVASVSNLTKELKVLKGEKVTHFLIPFGKGNLKYNKEYDFYWKEIYKQVEPDIVHIHGTEFAHSLSFVKACGSANVVVSIQGLKWVYYRYYLGGLSFRDILKNLTIRDFFKGTMLSNQKSFSETGKCETELIRSVKYVIGRTDWDRAHVWAVNPECQYFFGNETLRDEFYESKKWNYDDCDKYSIFLSQAYYPVKGLHKVLEAMPFILRQFPGAKIRVAGIDITKSDCLRDLFHLNGYGKYVKRKIKEYGLVGKIKFLGPLNAKQMIEEYLRSNVFICPSSIENSPNSLGEAQILGVPHLSSYVGGSMNMMKGNEDCLYRFEEVEMMAYKICNIFNNPNNLHLMINEASQRHNQVNNAQQLFNIYNTILSENRNI